MKKKDWLTWQPYIYAPNHHCAPPVSADGSPLFSFIQPARASCALGDSTLPCPSLSPSESQRKERLPSTCPSSAALEYLPFSFTIFHQKHVHFSMVSLSFCSNVRVTANATALPDLASIFIPILQSSVWQGLCVQDVSCMKEQTHKYT